MVRQNFPAPIFGLLFWLIFVSTGRTQNGGTWQTRAPMPVSRQELATGVLNGKVYVVGGRAGPSTDALEVYNPQTNTWSTLAPMPTARSGFAAAIVNNELWVFGGEDPQTLVLRAEVEVYSPATNSWRQLPNMPLPRHGIWASVIGHKSYIRAE